MTPDYYELLSNYPKHMSLEQMRVVCHISKKTARLLLRNGFVPCVDNGKKTRNYQIAKADIIEYLTQREAVPEKYTLPDGSYKRDATTAISSIDSSKSHPLVDLLPVDEYPDVMSVKQAAALSNVTSTTIISWIRKKHFIAFSKAGAYLIPKVSLLDYLSSPQYRHSPSGKQNLRSLFDKSAL